MATFTLSFLCAFAVIAALQVPGTSGEPDQRNSSPSSDITEIVDKHNDLRRNVQPSASNMLKMSWSTEAAVNAQRWANSCSMNHSPKTSRTISTGKCGENLYMASNKNTWSNAIQAWYDEIKDWKYGVGSVNGKVVGHFTQVVWYRSNLVGCAMAHCPNSQYKYFYVCQYCPAGNVRKPGQGPYKKPYKLGPRCADCPNDCDNGLCTKPCLHSDKYSNCADLAKQWGCSGIVGSWCKASCNCTNGQIM